MSTTSLKQNLMILPNRTYLSQEELCEYCDIEVAQLVLWDKEITDYISLISILNPIKFEKIKLNINKKFYPRDESIRIKSFVDTVRNNNGNSSIISSLNNLQLINDMHHEINSLLHKIKS